MGFVEISQGEEKLALGALLGIVGGASGERNTEALGGSSKSQNGGRTSPSERNAFSLGKDARKCTDGFKRSSAKEDEIEEHCSGQSSGDDYRLELQNVTAAKGRSKLQSSKSIIREGMLKSASNSSPETEREIKLKRALSKESWHHTRSTKRGIGKRQELKRRMAVEGVCKSG